MMSFHEIRDVSKRIKELDSQLSKTARVEYRTIPAAQKLISFGEIKAEYRRLEPQKGDDHLETKISEKEKELEEIEGQNIGIAESRELTISSQSCSNQRVQPHRPHRGWRR